METKRCARCGEMRPRSSFHVNKTGRQIGQLGAYCRSCETERGKEWRANNRTRSNAVQLNRLYRAGKSHPMSENKYCSSFLGIYLAETILSRYFDHIIKMPHNNPGYDFICGKGKRIDAKSSCLNYGVRGNPRWKFHIDRNKVADYFLCMGFDNRDSLEPMHVWLIPSEILNDQSSFGIIDSQIALSKWSKYEKPLDRALSCCEAIRSNV